MVKCDGDDGQVMVRCERGKWVERKWWKVMRTGNAKKECLCYGGKANVDVRSLARSPVSGQEEKESWRQEEKESWRRGEKESWRQEWVEGARESQEAMVPVHWDPTGFNLPFISTVSFLPISLLNFNNWCIHTLIWCYSKMVTLLPSAMFMLGLIRINSILLIPKEGGMRQKFPLVPIPLAREWIAFEIAHHTSPPWFFPGSSLPPLPFPPFWTNTCLTLLTEKEVTFNRNFWYFQQFNFWYFQQELLVLMKFSQLIFPTYSVCFPLRLE